MAELFHRKLERSAIGFMIAIIAAASVRERLGLAAASYNVVLAGGTFRAVPTLEEAVAERLAAPRARIVRLREEPAIGAVRLAVEALTSAPS